MLFVILPYAETVVVDVSLVNTPDPYLADYTADGAVARDNDNNNNDAFARQQDALALEEEVSALIQTRDTNPFITELVACFGGSRITKNKTNAKQVDTINRPTNKQPSTTTT